RCQHRIDELRVRHGLGVGISRVAFDAEDHDAQVDPDLRRGEPGAGLRAHRFAHVVEQRAQRYGIHALDFSRALEQARIAHAQDVADHGRDTSIVIASRRPAASRGASGTRGTTCSISARTRSMPASSTLAIASIDTLAVLSPRPAAWLTTTQTDAYSTPSSRASAASGMPVMPTIVAPSR